MKKKSKWSTFVLLLFFIIGLSVMLYPAISDYWNSRTQTQAIVDYNEIIEHMEKEDFTQIFAKADKYNADLRNLPMPMTDYEKLTGYYDILDVSGTGIMGYLTIDKIGLELPVYHGTEEDVLNIAVGHIQGTSVPVGGMGTHSVVSAHRGLPTATLFTNLDHLEVGDTFKFTVLDRTITYRVDQIKTVDPSDINDLYIESDKDMCTLLTCTPYGINSHRLLVRGVRIETVEEKAVYVTSDAYQIDSLIVTPIVAMPMLLVLMLIVLFKPVNKQKLGDDIE